VLGIKEQEALISKQRAEIADLRKRVGEIDALAQRIATLEAKLSGAAAAGR
jgi:hypothetical protein